MDAARPKSGDGAFPALQDEWYDDLQRSLFRADWLPPVAQFRVGFNPWSVVAIQG